MFTYRTQTKSLSHTQSAAAESLRVVKIQAREERRKEREREREKRLLFVTQKRVFLYYDA